MRKIISMFMPMLAVAMANKSIKKRLEENRYGKTELSQIEVDALDRLYETEKVRMESFEGKAKTTTMGLTIAISIMMGGSSLIGRSKCEWQFEGGYWMTIVLLLLATFFLLMAGLFSIKCFSDENKFYFVEPGNIGKKTEQAKMDYDICIQKNREGNLIRNNLICGAYESIKISMILLFACFVLSVIPI